MFTNSARVMFGMIAAGAIALVASPASAQADKDTKAPAAKAEPAKIGAKAPDFKLKDTEGKEVKLADYKGKIVVLQWFNPDCPVVKGFYENGANTFNDLASANKDVVFLAINSGGPGKQGAGVDRNAKAKKDWKIAYPVLIDESGDTGKAYGAKTTPHMYVIAADGTIAYMGAIDDGGGSGPGKTNYVAKAIEEVKSGQTVTTKETRPYGCGVKYKS